MNCCGSQRHLSSTSSSSQPEPTCGRISRGPRARDGPALDHGRANGRCRGPRGPNVLRATPSLRDSGRSADASSMPLQTGDAPNVPGPTCNGDPPVPNSPRSKRSLRWEAAPAPHTRPLVAVSRCTPKFALNSGRKIATASIAPGIQFHLILSLLQMPCSTEPQRGVNKMCLAASTQWYMALGHHGSSQRREPVAEP